VDSSSQRASACPGVPVGRLHLGDEPLRRHAQPARVGGHGQTTSPRNLEREIARYIETVIKALKRDRVLVALGTSSGCCCGGGGHAPIEVG
jgi:hypothetical protein